MGVVISSTDAGVGSSCEITSCAALCDIAPNSNAQVAANLAVRLAVYEHFINAMMSSLGDRFEALVANSKVTARAVKNEKAR